MKKAFFVIFYSLISLFILQACQQQLPIETNMSEKVADFTFINQDEQFVSLDDLKGQWWIADFVFTNCKTVCLPMTSNMSQLQNLIADEGLHVQLISFSVDPDYDTPSVLKEYGIQYEADFANWSFLTGYDFQTIKQLSIKSFRALLQEAEPGSDQVTHDTRFFLVDPNGRIVKGYNGVQTENIHLIMDDLVTLAEAGFIDS